MIRWTLYPIILLAALPWMLWMRLRHGKYRDNWKERLGLVLPKFDRPAGPLIWVHAVSVGETLAVIPFLEKLGCSYVVSSVTETAHAIAKQRLPNALAHFYLPLDFPWAMRTLARRIRPDLLVLAETEFWLNMLAETKAVGAQIIVINGKISEGSMRRFLWMPGYSRTLFGRIDRFLLQGEPFRDRFAKLGVPEDRMQVTGNIKLDTDPQFMSPQEKDALRQRLGIPAGKPVIVVGSTHSPEEELFLDAVQGLDVHLVLVPRHPPRFDEVAALLDSRGVSYRRVSTGGEGAVTLVDAMGMLRACYQIATIAVVAGSFTDKVGGHNIVEACAYGVPTVYGPYLASQPVLADLMNGAGAGLQIPAEKVKEELKALLADEPRRRALGEAGRKLDLQMRGATDATIREIRKIGLADKK